MALGAGAGGTGVIVIPVWSLTPVWSEGRQHIFSVEPSPEGLSLGLLVGGNLRVHTTLGMEVPGEFLGSAHLHSILAARRSWQLGFEVGYKLRDHSRDPYRG